MTILPHMRKLGYDPLSSFTPISMVGGGGVIVVVLPSSKATDMKSLIELAKKDPKNWSYGTYPFFFLRWALQPHTYKRVD